MTAHDEQTEALGKLLLEHQPTTAMRVAMGVTCRCGYWTGVEVAGKTRPVGYSGLQWHQIQVLTAEVAEVKRAAAEKAWDDAMYHMEAHMTQTERRLGMADNPSRRTPSTEGERQGVQ